MSARRTAGWLAAAAVSAMLAAGAAFPAQAEGFYSINGYPADGILAGQLVALGLPFGNYWLRPNGDWGVVGSYWPAGNIYANGGGAGSVLVGSAERSGNGSWNGARGLANGAGVADGMAGGMTGGVHGCFQTATWSNC